jgi:hypothetical protein
MSSAQYVSSSGVVMMFMSSRCPGRPSVTRRAPWPLLRHEVNAHSDDKATKGGPADVVDAETGQVVVRLVREEDWKPIQQASPGTKHTHLEDRQSCLHSGT